MFEHLRTHVVRGASECGGHIVSAHQNTGNTKVAQFDQVVSEEYVSVLKTVEIVSKILKKAATNMRPRERVLVNEVS